MKLVKTYLPILLISLLTVTRGRSAEPYASVRIDNVPHVQQKPDFCGEACAENEIIRMELKPGKIKAPKRGEGFTDADFAQHIMQLKEKIPSDAFTMIIQKPFVVIGDEHYKFYHAFYAARADDPTGYKTLQSVLGKKDMAAFKKEWEAYVLKLRFGG